VATQYDSRMLPSTADSGRRLAAIAPTALKLLTAANTTTPLDAVVIMLVDGLGWSNLRARLGHAPTMRKLPMRRIETVAPSTTGAALPALTTGSLPGQHGLIGYRIMNPETGKLTTTLSEWDDIDDVRTWQRSTTVFTRARNQGVRAFAAARPAHQDSGLTRAMLTDAHYLPAQTIEERFGAARAALDTAEKRLVYLYVDELDRAGHAHGWQSDKWLRRLEQFDESLNAFLKNLPERTGVVITADHGMIDIEQSEHVLLDEQGLLDQVAHVGGEPRCRYLYLEHGVHAQRVAQRIQRAEGERAWVGTRDQWIEAGVFGKVAAEVAPRLGDVIIAARERVAYYTLQDDPQARSMIGQHGSFDDDERGIPVVLGGAFAHAADSAQALDPELFQRVDRQAEAAADENSV
jgi:hypothetical protein